MRDSRPIFSDEQKAAFRLVESLLAEGLVVLGPDRWVEGSLRFQRPLVAEVEAAKGEAISFALDPLEQAIDQAARLVAEAEGELAIKLSHHLDALLAKQLLQVSGR